MTLGENDQVLTEKEKHAMTHHDDARLVDLLAQLGNGDSKDLFRRLLERGMQDLIDAELTATIGAELHERTDTRTNQRNGARERTLSTPAGDIELRIPKLRVGSFFPSLLEPRRRVDQALWAVIMTAYITGTSTRKVDDLVPALGCESGVSKSTVSRICKGIDTEVAVFRTRGLGHLAMPYVYLDATYIKARSNHRIVGRAVVVATAVTIDGNREVLGVDVGDSEDEVFWTAFLRTLRDRGLTSVRLVISDAHAGLKASIARVFAGASWQRCKVHLAAEHLGHGQPRPQGHGRRHRAHDPRPTRRRGHPSPTPHRGRDARGPVPQSRRGRRRSRKRRHRVRGVPEGALAQDLEHEPVGADQQRDQAPLERGRNLPRRRLGHPPRRRRLVGATRRVGRRRTPLPLRRIHGPHRPTPPGGDRHRTTRTPGRLNSANEAKGHRPTSTTRRDATAAEALSYVWEHRTRVLGLANPVGYAFRVGQRWATRQQRRRRRRFGFATDGNHPPGFEPALHTALAALSLRQRQVVVLCVGYGLTHEEAADVLGISRSTVQNHAERGLRQLRRKVGT